MQVWLKGDFGMEQCNMEFKAIQTPDGFWCFEQNGVRSFLIEGIDDALVIDTCFGGDLAELCRLYTSHPIQLLLTHSDHDHVGCVDQFDYYMMHPSEFDRWANLGGNLKKAIPAWEGENFNLTANYQITGYSLDVVHLPGHTPGSIGLIERQRRFLIAGDVIQNSHIYMFGPGRNLAAYRASLLKLMGMEDAIDRIYSSHGDMVVRSEFIRQMYCFVNDISRGLIKDHKPATAHLNLPENIRLFERDECQILLEV